VRRSDPFQFTPAIPSFLLNERKLLERLGSNSSRALEGFEWTEKARRRELTAAAVYEGRLGRSENKEGLKAMTRFANVN